MIEAKESLVGKVSQTQEINGNINKEVIIIEPKLQEKEATPTEQTQIITPDTNFDGISKMTINPIPSEYVVPSGTLNITQNGEYNVKNYETANVATSGVDINDYFYTTAEANTSGSNTLKVVKNAPDITVANNVSSLNAALTSWTQFYVPKVICSNSITNMAGMYSGVSQAQNIDATGLNMSNVASVSQMFSNVGRYLNNGRCLITFSDQVDTSKVNDFSYMFSYARVECDLSKFSCDSATAFGNMFQDTQISTIDLSNFKTHNATSLSYMFANCTATSIDLSNFEIGNATNTSRMFWCGYLQHLDIRKMEFDNVSNNTQMFLAVPNNCEIIVKNDTQKTWITTNFSNLTNVKTVEEYNAERE